MGNVHQLPGAILDPPPEPAQGPTMTPGELYGITGYLRPGQQLKALHLRGFTRAWRSAGGKVILERSHYDAVTRGQFGATPAANDGPHTPLPPNRAGFRAKFGNKSKGQ